MAPTQRQGQQMETKPYSSSLTFTRLTDDSAFTRRHHHLHTTTVHHLTQPDPLPSDRPWIFTSSSAAPAVLLHPLTSKPLSNFPHNLNLSQFDRSTLAVSYHLDLPHLVDKLLICHGSKHLTQPTSFQLNNSIIECTMFALYGGGEIRACPRVFEAEEKEDGSPWVKLSQPGVKFDDIVFHEGVIYAVGRQRRITSIDVHPSTRKISIAKTLDSSGPSRRFGWRKRFVVHGENLYLVVRKEEEVFRVYKRKRRVMCRNEIAWEVVKGFEGDKVLFMSRDHYFFRNAFKKFPGREYKNCIVFSEAAFPQYGLDCWEFTQSDDDVSRCEDDIAIFCLNDGTFARDGENPCFPKIDWSPPAWIFNAYPLPAHEFRCNVAPECHSQSERGPDEDEGLKFASRDANDGGLQSDLKNLDSRVKEEPAEEMEHAFSNKDQYQKGMGSGSDSQDQEDQMQCDSNCQDEDMHSKAKIEEDTTEVMALSLSTGAEEVGRTLLSMSSGSDAIEEGFSGKNIIHLIPKPSTSCTTQSDKSDSETTRIKFEGFNIRCDLVPTLEKIWLKHGNIVKDSIVHNSNIIATSLEALAIMVRELEDNSAKSLSDSQAGYLSSTLSDLKCIRFEVDWLSSFVEKALNIHKSKSLVESVNNLRFLSSQAKERRAILFDELTKLDVEETKRKEQIEKVSKMVSFYGQAMFDEPVGAGLT